MIQDKDIEDFYNTEIHLLKESFKHEASKIKRRYIKCIIYCVISFILAVIINFFSLIFIAISVFYYFRIQKYKEQYESVYKEKIVKAFFSKFYPDWEYFPNKGISLKEFNNAYIFPERYTDFYSDDMVVGKVDKTNFVCSEVLLEYVREDANGEGLDSTITVFNGIFLIADFNKHLKAKTVLKPISYGRGKLPLFESFFLERNIIQLEDPVFNRNFRVFSTSQQEARYILTPNMMKILVDLKSKLNKRVHIGFHSDKVFFGIDYDRKLFSTHLLLSDHFDLDMIKDFISIFEVNKQLINELDLNTRIWTKD